VREPTHPVVEVLTERHAAGSQPGARQDSHRVALVLEGGSMRGVVSAGSTAALERLGLTRCFDLVVGSSAGALNGGALISGDARAGASMYHGVLASRRFVNPARLLVGRPALDVRFVLHHANRDLDPGRHERTLTSPIELHCVALDVDSGRPHTFTGMKTIPELAEVMLATTRMPWIGGDPVRLDGRRYVDGALACPIPVQEALDAGATHVLVLQTRPFGVPRTTGSPVKEWLVLRQLQRVNPALAAMWRDRAVAYETLVADIAERSARPPADGPQVLGLRPAAGTPVVSQLERRPERLQAGARDGEELVDAAFGPALERAAAAVPR
jgi:predicted patatin/cPLA2 family phospholipase